MAIKFEIADFNNGPVAVFNNEPQPQARLLSIFLEAVRPDPSSILKEIDKAETGNTVPAGFTYNDIDVEIYSDRVVLEELYPASGNEDDAESAEFSLEDIKDLVKNWQTGIEKWLPKNRIKMNNP